MKPSFLICALLFSVSLYGSTLKTVSGYSSIPSQCVNYTSIQTKPRVDHLNQSLLVIPPHLTNQNDRELIFSLKPSSILTPTTLHERECKFAEIIELSLEDQYNSVDIPNQYPFQDQNKYLAKTYFNTDGYLHHNGHFWNPVDYCILSISDYLLKIKTCKLDCSADMSKTYLHAIQPEYESSRVCIPKCCGVDEILSQSKFTCRKLNDTEPNYFLPYLHLQTPLWYYSETNKNPNRDKYKILAVPKLNEDRGTWNRTHSLYGGYWTIWNNLHFIRNTMKCSNYLMRKWSYDGLQFSDTPIPSNKYNYRIEIQPETVQLTFLSKSRKWLNYPEKFCVDGLDEWGKEISSDRAVSQVVVFCVDKMPSISTLSDPESDSIIKLTQDNTSSLNFSKIIYLLVLAICIIFMLVLYLPTYKMSWKSLNFNGKLIAVHLYSVLVWYALIFIGLIISLSYSGNADMLITRDGLNSGESPSRTIGWFCVTLGIFSHYFYLARYLCLCTLNNGAFSKISATGYWPYGIFSWILPFVIVILSCVADLAERDPWSTAIVPDYGVESCNVASWSAGYYVHLLIAIILVLNLVNIVVRTRNATESNEEAENENENGETPTLLYTCVWFVSTIAWFLTFVDWTLAYYEYEENFGRMLLLIIAAVWETLVLCYLYCLSESVMGIMTSKLGWTQGAVNFLVGYGLIQKGDGMAGRILKDEGNTVAVGESNELTNREISG